MTPIANDIERLLEKWLPNLPRLDREDFQPVLFDKYQLPPSFIDFSTALPNHNGWPHQPPWPGIYSPFGVPSPLTRRNMQLRSMPPWPHRLVSFMQTDDGDYCFDYSSPASEPYITYADHWSECYTWDATPFVTWADEYFQKSFGDADAA